MKAIADLIHDAGGYFYCDGANYNAIVGRVRPGDLGVDAMHINLHKTFSTPHGGGGPGAGPAVLSAALAPFAPLPRIVDAQAMGVDAASRYGSDATAVRPPLRVSRPDGHVCPRADLYAQPRQRRPAASRGRRGAERQLPARAPASRTLQRAVRRRPVHARSAVRRSASSKAPASKPSISPRRCSTRAITR